MQSGIGGGKLDLRPFLGATATDSREDVEIASH